MLKWRKRTEKLSSDSSLVWRDHKGRTRPAPELPAEGCWWYCTVTVANAKAAQGGCFLFGTSEMVQEKATRLFWSDVVDKDPGMGIVGVPQQYWTNKTPPPKEFCERWLSQVELAQVVPNLKILDLRDNSFSDAPKAVVN